MKISKRAFTNSWTLRIAVLILAAAILALVIASPIALQRIADLHGIKWIRLSNVGQTYGAVSALLTALALGGVVASLLYQARDVKTAREQTSRTIHQELMKMEMEDPFYMTIMGAPTMASRQQTDYDSLRRHHFIHLWVSFWEGQYVLREMSDSYLRDLVRRNLFVSRAGRQYWSVSRKIKLEGSEGRHLRFNRIVDEEYNQAIAMGPPMTISLINNPGNVIPDVSSQRSRVESGILICAATGGAILAGRLLGRQLRKKTSVS